MSGGLLLYNQAVTNQEQLSAILSSMAEGLIAVDNDRKIILMNQAAGILLRVAPPEAVGQDVNQILNFFKNDKPIAYQNLPIEKAIKERNIISLNLLDNVSVQNKVGRVFPVVMIVAPLLAGREISGAIILFRDATHEKQIDQAKTEFVSLASHQLRTPLSAINWYSEMMLGEEVGTLNDKQKEYLNNLYEANRRMVDLVNALLNVSRIDLGTFAVEPEPTDLAKLVESVILELTPKLTEKKISLKPSLDHQLPLVSVDPKLVRIIFQNLLSNAVKYTPPGGRVEVGLEKKEESVLFRVADSGYGIPAVDQSKIFTKLFRADNIRDKEAEGTGLGLYIVKSIVEQAGGKISFDSLEGRGTTFSVLLPLLGMKRKTGAKGLS